MLTLTRDYIEHHMARVLSLWYEHFPKEARAHEERAKFERWQDEGRKRKQEIRSKGNIPMRIWIHFCQIDPDFWADKRNMRLFWRLYPKARTAAKRVKVGG